MKDSLNGEYAKIVKQEVGVSTRGMQATITLPNTKSFYGGYDFINFYMGIGEFECGISTKSSVEDGSWHWFVNSSSGVWKEGEWNIKDGDKVNIKLCLDDITNEVMFLVNGSKVYQDNRVNGLSFNNTRMVVGSAQQSTGITEPLREWKVFHSQLFVENLMYKNTSKQWIPCNHENTNTKVIHNPTNVYPYPTPVDYVVTELKGSPASFYASLKDFS
jgi:hypothetical protein